MVSASQPVIGRMIALETRYEVSTQVASSRLADNEPAICTSETLAIDVSSTYMNAASPQTRAIRYGASATSGFAQVSSTAISAGLLPELRPALIVNVAARTNRQAGGI